MQYFYTYHYYFDCPTCDGFSDEIMLSEAFTSDIELIQDIGKYANANMCLAIHSLDTDGTITKVADVHDAKGMHKVLKVWFDLNGHTYMYTWDVRKQSYNLETTNEKYNLIYGNVE